MTGVPRQEAVDLLRRLRADAVRFDIRPSLAGIGMVRLEVFRAVREALERHGYYELPVPTREKWLAAIDGAIAEMDGGDDGRDEK